MCIRAKVLVVRGSPIHYLLVRANHYGGRVGLVNNVDDALRQLKSASSGRQRQGDDDDDDVVLLTDAVVADHIARHVRTCYCTLMSSRSTAVKSLYMWLFVLI